jgi:hypothetical protein
VYICEEFHSLNFKKLKIITSDLGNFENSISFSLEVEKKLEPYNNGSLVSE